MKTLIHHDTGETLVRGVRKETIRHGTFHVTFDQPGWFPEGDGEGILDHADAEIFDRHATELRRAYVKHLKEVRLKLGLTQEAASLLIGGGKRAFQKYESGRVPPSEAATKLIEILFRHPELIEEVRGFEDQTIDIHQVA